MHYEKIKEELDDFLNLTFQNLSEIDLEDILYRLSELTEIMDRLNETDENDIRYVEIMDMISEIKCYIDEEINARELDQEYDPDDF